MKLQNNLMCTCIQSYLSEMCLISIFCQSCGAFLQVRLVFYQFLVCCWVIWFFPFFHPLVGPLDHPWSPSSYLPLSLPPWPSTLLIPSWSPTSYSLWSLLIGNINTVISKASETSVNFCDSTRIQDDIIKPRGKHDKDNEVKLESSAALRAASF